MGVFSSINPGPLRDARSRCSCGRQCALPSACACLLFPFSYWFCLCLLFLYIQHLAPWLTAIGSSPDMACFVLPSQLGAGRLGSQLHQGRAIV